MKTKPMTVEERIKMVRPALDLFVEDDAIAELRVLGSADGPQFGMFDDRKKMARTAAEASGKGDGVYFTLNPVKESLSGRVKNRLMGTSSAVKDDDIARRRWFPVDFDPVRPGKSPATNAEHDDALATAEDCRNELGKLGWPDPVVADSGNGAHLQYRVDLPNDQKSYRLVRNCLLGIALRFATGAVMVDTGNGNASRLTRVYGTMNCKGEETEDRGYRRARLLAIPEKIETVTAEQLAQIAGAVPGAPTQQIEQGFGVEEWLKKYDVEVAFDARWNKGDHKWILTRCPWNETHKKSAFIARFANGGVAAGCLHSSCRERNWPQLRTMFEGRSEAESQSNQTTPTREQRTPQVAQLIQLANPDLTLFQTPQGEPYASIKLETHSENHAVDSSGFRQFLNRKFFRATKTAPQPAAVNQAVEHFGAVGQFDSLTEPTFIRVGRLGPNNYLDLVNGQWEAVEFRTDGWRVVGKPPIRFRRVKGMLPLPQPVQGGNINDLREFLNLKTDEDWVLFVTALIDAICADGPYPILEFYGEAGSAKTTATRVTRKMVDPNASLVRGMPRDERDLMVTAHNGWALCFDNLSYLPGWLSDCFCRMSTGGGNGTRSLYTDSDEFIFDGQRPVVLNGIEELAIRTDLLDRTVLLELPVIRKFTTEKEFWRKFDAAHPQLLGALLDVAVGALQELPKVTLAEPPRMADFARLGTAAESVLGFSRGTFMRAYTRNRKNATAVALEACPFSNQISELAKNGWKGTATQLLSALDNAADDESRSRRGWPKIPKNLSGMLRRLSPALRTGGVEIEFNRDETRNRNRIIVIRQRGTPKQEQ